VRFSFLPLFTFSLADFSSCRRNSAYEALVASTKEVQDDRIAALGETKQLKVDIANLVREKDKVKQDKEEVEAQLAAVQLELASTLEGMEKKEKELKELKSYVLVLLSSSHLH
jgi:septal ring factor EnvC (AmiA/AmiB activator)